MTLDMVDNGLSCRSNLRVLAAMMLNLHCMTLFYVLCVSVLLFTGKDKNGKFVLFHYNLRHLRYTLRDLC